MFRVLVLVVLVSLGWVAVCACVGGGGQTTKPPSLQPSGGRRGGGVRRRDPRPAARRLRLLRGFAGGASAPAGALGRQEREGPRACVGGFARGRGDGDVEALRGGQGLGCAPPAGEVRPGRRLHAARPRDPEPGAGDPGGLLRKDKEMSEPKKPGGGPGGKQGNGTILNRGGEGHGPVSNKGPVNRSAPLPPGLRQPPPKPPARPKGPPPPKGKR